MYMTKRNKSSLSISLQPNSLLGDLRVYRPCLIWTFFQIRAWIQWWLMVLYFVDLFFKVFLVLFLLSEASDIRLLISWWRFVFKATIFFLRRVLALSN